MRRPLSPVLRITIALVALTLALVMSAYALRLIPDSNSEALQHRKRTVEAVTVQVSAQSMHADLRDVEFILDTLVERNAEVLSAGLRVADGALAVEAGPHAQNWHDVRSGRSTAEHVRVPIYDGPDEVGSLEVRFAPLPSSWAISPGRGTVGTLLLFLFLAGSAGYFIILRRSLKSLDPAAVIPDRVRLAMDTLVEGVMILDERQNILLANRAFENVLGVSAGQLLGHEANQLNWRSTETGGVPGELPWVAAIRLREPATDRTLDLRVADGRLRTFAVNATPVLDPRGRVTGALASFDDVTELRLRNDELQRILGELETSRRAIEKQNAELAYLAVRDPLTGCLNRRAFFEAFETAFEAVRGSGEWLHSAMVDIDHFKRVNDDFGHATGDRVIAFVAEVLRLHARETDLVARYGGEEFCLVFAGVDGETVCSILEQIREAVIAGASSRFPAELRLTISSGYAVQLAEDDRASAMVERADVALYAAKNTGRNRVVCWQAGMTMAGDNKARSEARAKAQPEVQQGQATQLVPSGSSAPAGAAVKVAPLTGMLLRDELREQVHQAIALAARHQWTAALLRIEISALGEQTESVLDIARERILGLLRRSDTLMQLSGRSDSARAGKVLPRISIFGLAELGILLTDTRDVAGVGIVVQRIVAALGEPVVIDGRESFVVCAIGIAVAPTDGEDFDSLMSSADQARRAAATRSAGECYAFYQPSMTERLLHVTRLERGLRQALERDELHVVYQPQLELASGLVRRFEALLRWMPRGGQPVPPDRFIGVAESTGLINPIGDWVLEQACRQACAWARTSGRPRGVAINISPIQIMAPDFVERVGRIIARTGVDPAVVELEITETAFMNDPDAAAVTLQALRRIGVRIALDDFGTGYSSLGYLKQLPIDTLKIDTRFVRDLHDSSEGIALVQAIIAMAHGLGIRVIAEGVETVEALQLLERLGCDEVQGYVIARPLPASEAIVAGAARYMLSDGELRHRPLEPVPAGLAELPEIDLAT